ncbi:hypothetical protein FH972_026462 [Carpinus fangiana]|uniref:Amino acid transporter transmembrane domain-containing protein n=1 Tax=Carpinus fangiana TaxID=176857 RepID=A0A5N6L4J0_9ROSI|nr:hypothetical protein FH972_026462 [Carpinus fangiana]
MTDTPSSEQQERSANVLSPHLPDGYSASPDVLSGAPPNQPSAEAQEDSLALQGGDIHRDLYKIDARARVPKRAATFSGPSRSAVSEDGIPDLDLTAAEQRQPGGFRRQFLLRQHQRLNSVTVPVTKNFVDFLALYGSFAGEDLAETDDEEDESAVQSEEEDESPPTERRPLLGRRKSTKRQAKAGDAGLVKSFFTLLKAFIGTGIMFLPKAFNNGGILFSSITLMTVSLLSCVCFHLLLQCRQRVGGGYGEIGGAIGGPRLRNLILGSITISQIGFVCAGLIFTAENLMSFFDAVTTGPRPLSTTALIGIQLIILIPLSLIRNISKLGPSALLADICIAIGLTYIYHYDISALASRGMDKTVVLFNPDHFTLTVGSAIFTFEGIGLILPIQSSMRQPKRFAPLLFVVMFIVTIVFASVGILSYATFGTATRTEIITNYPQTSRLVNAVQFIYSFAVLVGEPVQLFPAVRILEGALFGHRSGKQSAATKWRKNGLRCAIVLLTGVISAVGASDLDKFVALIGSFACVPLVYIYPAWLHYKGVAESRTAKGLDVGMMVVGLVAMVYTTFITVSRWIAE